MWAYTKYKVMLNHSPQPDSQEDKRLRFYILSNRTHMRETTLLQGRLPDGEDYNSSTKGSRFSNTKKPSYEANKPLSVSQLLSNFSETKTFSLSNLGGGVVPENPEDTDILDSSKYHHSHAHDGEKYKTNSPKKFETNIEQSNTFVQKRLKRQWNIANIIPVNDVRLMTRKHWSEVFLLESRYQAVDWSSRSECSILGHRQMFVTRDHRHRIVKWMSEACRLFNWASQTFFTAVHAWDTYITLIEDPVETEDLAQLSAACLYFGAQLVESAADENVRTLEEFREICPEVGTVAGIREIQAHLVDTLQGASLVRRTPIDFLLLFLAQMQIAPSPCPQLYKQLIEKNLLDVLWDLTLSVCLVIYTNGLILDGLPGSRWVIGVIIRILEFLCPALRTDSEAHHNLCYNVFHLSSDIVEKHQVTVIDPIIKAAWYLVVDVTTKKKSTTHNGDNSLNVKSRFTRSLGAPYDIIRHHEPDTFMDWPLTFPLHQTVQDISARLRSISFDSCTPPNVMHLTTQSSGQKRISGAKDKSRRYTTLSTLGEDSSTFEHSYANTLTEKKSMKDDAVDIPETFLLLSNVNKSTSMTNSLENTHPPLSLENNYTIDTLLKKKYNSLSNGTESTHIPSRYDDHYYEELPMNQSNQQQKTSSHQGFTLDNELIMQPYYSEIKKNHNYSPLNIKGIEEIKNGVRQGTHGTKTPYYPN